jgi:hypothetical protein
MSRYGNFFPHFLYMAIPLLFIIVIQKSSPEFDIEAVGQAFLVLMIPINVVGLIQYFIDPKFLVSFEYNKMGGIVLRNFADGIGSYSRYPSLFASAGRYSAMGLMQFLFSLVLFNSVAGVSRKKVPWLLFNLIFAFVAMGIAGARSRILIAIIEIVLLAFAQTVNRSRRPALSGWRIASRPLLGLSVIAIPLIFITAIMTYGGKEVPIARMLQQSLEQGDISKRIYEGVEKSLLPDHLSLFGEGMGSALNGHGVPGEFGIAAIWAESGLVFGSLLLIVFIWFSILLAKVCRRCATNGLWQSFVVSSISLMILLSGLLAGLSMAFELSTGLLFGCAVAVAARLPVPNQEAMNTSTYVRPRQFGKRLV